MQGSDGSGAESIAAQNHFSKDLALCQCVDLVFLLSGIFFEDLNGTFTDKKKFVPLLSLPDQVLSFVDFFFMEKIFYNLELFPMKMFENGVVLPGM
jgi:hypothetical protein